MNKNRCSDALKRTSLKEDNHLERKLFRAELKVSESTESFPSGRNAACLKIFPRLEAWFTKQGNSFAKNVFLCGIAKGRKKEAQLGPAST